MSLAALALATPLFGLSLSVDSTLAYGPAVATGPAIVASTPFSPSDDEGDGGSSGPSTAEQLAARGRMAPIHKWMGISTWVSMTATVVLGFIQYHNLYGFGASLGDTPCDQGTAVFGYEACLRQPLPHLISSILTTALYSVTFGLSYRMPDPMNFDEQDSDYGKNLRRHKRLRWVHLVGMIAQMGLGIVIANANRFGIDRANDYGTLQALSAVHMALGLTTYAALTWSGLIFIL